MDMLRISSLGVCAAIAALLLRRMKPEFGHVTALAAGILMIMLILPQLTQLLQGITSIATTGGLTQEYMGQLLKICGVSLLMDFSSQTCRDAGESGLAMKVELAGRVTLIALSLPFMQALLTQILSLAP